MRIEGYLHLDFGGQFRFAVDAFEVERMVKKEKVKVLNYSGLLESKRMYDYLWDVSMRSRPTLHELMDRTDERSRLVKAGFDTSVYEHLVRNIEKILAAPNKTIKSKMGNAYVEFAYVPQS